MYFLHSIATCIVSACVLTLTTAHSTERNPLAYLTRVSNAHVSTPSQRIHAHTSFELSFDLHGGEQRIRLVLSPNHDVIAEGATVSYLAADGTLRTSEAIERKDYRVFKGQTFLRHVPGAEWTNVGWARIMVKQDGENPLFEGAFRVDGDHHHVQTRTHYMQTKHALDPVLEAADEESMVVWRDSDVGEGFQEDAEGLLHPELKRSVGGPPSCSADGLSFNTQPDHPVFRAMMKREDSYWGSISTRKLFGRQIDGQTNGNSAGINLTTSIGSPAGCPSTRKVALVGIATDCTYTGDFNSTESARANVINVLNTASSVYEESFNITLGLLNLTVSDAACPASATTAAPWNVGCSGGITIQDRLNLFSAWRGQYQDSNAYWTLLSTCATDTAVGLAWLGQACVNSAQTDNTASGNETVSGANVVVRTGTEWQVLAHETGHTFGAVHDCDSSTCADGTTVASQQCCPLSAEVCDAGGAYIMNPSTGSNIKQFSPCTIGNICSAIGRNSVKTSCLSLNRNVPTLQGGQCGNGIVETGEDCDCGGEASCAGNSCCDPTTCKFTTNSFCDPSNEDCCTSSCQFANNGTVCRTSTGVCEPQEVCSGSSATCPADNTVPDGTSCGNSLSCAAGQCTSRDLQCKSIMGSYTQGNDTYACSSSGCQISCGSPEFGSNVCYSMQQNFLDGTSCGGGGKCNNGQCKGSSVGKEISSWIDSHKTLVIALSSSIGGLLVILLLWYCVSSYMRRSRIRNRPVAPPPMQSNNNGWGGGNDFQPPPPAQMRGAGGASPGWRENERWQQPPPQWSPGPSVRYA